MSDDMPTVCNNKSQPPLGKSLKKTGNHGHSQKDSLGSTSKKQKLRRSSRRLSRVPLDTTTETDDNSQSSPLKKPKSSSKKSSSKKQAKKRKSLTSDTQSSTAEDEGQDEQNHKTVVNKEGYCPLCQMPFQLLIVQTPTWHVTECMQANMPPEIKECPYGKKCDSSMSSHYMRFKHETLAQDRASVKVSLSPRNQPSNKGKGSFTKKAARNLSYELSGRAMEDCFVKVEKVQNGKENICNDESDNLEVLSELEAEGCDVTVTLITETQTENEELPTISGIDPINLSSITDNSILHVYSKHDINKGTQMQTKPKAAKKSGKPEKTVLKSLRVKESKDHQELVIKSDMDIAHYSNLNNVAIDNVGVDVGAGVGKAVDSVATSSYFSSASAVGHVKEEKDYKSVLSAKKQRKPRTCPDYKRICGTQFTVDAFSYGLIPDCTAFFLTHFHADHYMGLGKRFKGSVYCTKVTKNLVKLKIGTADEYLNEVALDDPIVIEDVKITFLEANHCPGAVLILFELKTGKVYLHTGDFRATEYMEKYPPLLNKQFDQLFLDTTYCNPRYTFPPIEEVLSLAVTIAKAALAENPNTLIVCGTYTIGKEKVFLAIAEALGCKVFVKKEKKDILECLENDRISKLLVENEVESQLHVLPMNILSYVKLYEYLQQQKQFTSVLAFEPSGWTFSKRLLSLEHLKPRIKKNSVTLYAIPYSEHSSYEEMKKFVQFIKPKKVIPTVNNDNAASSRKMEAFFQAWLDPNKAVTSTQTKLHDFFSN